MNPVTTAAAALVAALAFGIGGLAQGQSAGPPERSAQASPPPAQSSPPAARPAPLPMVSGRIEKVDAAAGKITIAHGRIPNLDMDAMTMVFRAADPGLLKKVKRGDQVRFTADLLDGQLTVTKIQKGQ